YLPEAQDPDCEVGAASWVVRRDETAWANKLPTLRVGNIQSPSPAFAGAGATGTSIEEGMSNVEVWIPAFAGMTEKQTLRLRSG
ncbi:MAG: hypothetical protein ACYTEL_26270, partial [Planctomycetota bacterium]